MNTELSDSWVRRLNPITKLLMVPIFGLATIIFPNLYLGLVLLILVVFLAWQAKILKGFLKITVGFGIPIALMLFIIQGLYSPSNKTYIANLGFAKLGLEGLMYGTKLLVTLLVFVGAFYVFNKTIYSGELSASLTDSHLNPKIGYLILASLNVVPQMQRQLTVVKEAQAARGVKMTGSIFTRIKAFIPLMAPVVLSSLINAQERGMALELRGLGLNNSVRTTYIQVADTRVDKVLRLGMIIFLGIIVVVSIFMRMSGR